MNEDGMSRYTPANHHAFFPASIVWVRLLALCSGLGLASASLAAAAQAPTAAESAEPIYTTAEQLLTPQRQAAAPPLAPAPLPASVLRTSPTAALRAPAAAASRPAPAPISLLAQQLPSQPAAPAAEAEAPAPASPPASAPESAPASAPAAPLAVPNEVTADPAAPAGYGSVFIDPTEYNVGATESADSPSLVFAERSSGCQITVAPGASASAQACGGSTASRAANQPASSQAGLRIGPVTVNSRGVSLGNTTVISREYLNEKMRPLNVLRRGTEQYVFPLAIPAPITSLFGWRVHPIFGNHRFHSGTDIGAPTGTPVLATRAGQVSVSDFLGGYGLTVILRHDGDLESRYAHLSQILVQPGERVEQGDVIGLVGSTGNSTGPHLHFEIRQLTAQGWVAVDPQEILEYGVARLIQLIDNPMLALSRVGQPAENADRPTEAVDLPYRPAQPNAS